MWYSSRQYPFTQSCDIQLLLVQSKYPYKDVPCSIELSFLYCVDNVDAVKALCKLRCNRFSLSFMYVYNAILIYIYLKDKDAVSSK